MKDRDLLALARGFRRGLLDGRPSAGMCFVVSAALGGLLAAYGVDTELVEAIFPEINHYWLQLTDGRILDATADQFGLAPIYLGPLPEAYERRRARLIDVAG